MTFLAPAFLLAAGAVAAAVVALHFIVTREPRTVPLPTARFAPDRPVRAQSRAIHPQDLLLLALRVLVILAVGGALAQPVVRPQRRDLARILLVDRSRAVANPAEVIDSARSLLSEGDALVLFDESATVVHDAAADSLAALTLSRRTGSLSAALIAGLRTASAMRDAADSFEVAVISPLVADEVDAATDSVRALWPGGIRVMRVDARRDSTARVTATIVGAVDDPLRFALPPGEDVPRRDTVRVVRTTLTAADSSWLGAAPGRVLVYWPAVGSDSAGVPALPPSWAPRWAPDTVGAVVAGSTVIVAPFERYAALRAGRDSSNATGGGGLRVVARWVDGEPAATEARYEQSCLRTVTVSVPARGDLVLRPRFAQLVAALLEPCGGAVSFTPLGEARVASLAGSNDAALVAQSAITRPTRIELPLVPWLYAAALAFAVGALIVRRRAAARTIVTAAARSL